MSASLRMTVVRGVAVLGIGAYGLFGGARVEAQPIGQCTACLSEDTCGDIMYWCQMLCSPSSTGGLCGHLDECDGLLGIICTT